MKILLTGANGQLGRCFQDIVPKDWILIPTDSDILDITQIDAVESLVAKHRPDIIVNAAAYTAVDKAELEQELAYKINAIGPQNLAKLAEKYHAKLFHVSTDYVFDGNNPNPYVETDKTNPLGVYGKTKLEGEVLVQQESANAVIIRTAWVFSEYGNNFVKTMLRLAKERDELKIVNDQFGCPTYAGDIAKAIITLIQAKSAGGCYHYCGQESMSWYDFACKIIRMAYQQNKIEKMPKVVGISTSEYPTPAHRPKNSVLNCGEINQYKVNFTSLSSNLSHVISCM